MPSYLSGIGVARSTGTAVTLFCGDPSITRSEYVRYTSVLRGLSTMRTIRSFLNTSEIRSLNTSSWAGSGRENEIGPTWQALDRRLGLVFREPEPAFDAAGLRARDVTGDTADLRIVVGIDDDLVIRSDELEYRVDLADRLGAGKPREQKQQSR